VEVIGHKQWERNPVRIIIWGLKDSLAPALSSEASATENIYLEKKQQGKRRRVGESLGLKKAKRIHRGQTRVAT